MKVTNTPEPAAAVAFAFGAILDRLHSAAQLLTSERGNVGKSLAFHTLTLSDVTLDQGCLHKVGDTHQDA